MAIIWAVTKGYLDKVPTNKIEAFEQRFIADLQARGLDLIENINKNKVGKVIKN